MRYPKSGRGRKWTIKELEAIPLDWRGDTLSAAEGLFGDVRVAADGNLSVPFRYGFKWQGKKTWYYCGTWPATDLAAIHARRDQARSLVKAGTNPNDDKKATRVENQSKVQAILDAAESERTENLPFEAMFEAWITDGVARKDGNAELRRAFAKDVLSSIGKKPVRLITEHDLRSLLRVVVKRGVNRTAVRLYHDMVQLFAWAEKRAPWRGLMIEGNPAELLEIGKIVSPDYDLNEERTRILSPAELRELRDKFDQMEVDYKGAQNKRVATRPLKKESQIAIWICLSTLCRIGELLKAEWEHVDLDRSEWFIPKANAKRTRGKQQDHAVYLSDFARRQFESLRAITSDSRWCFPARNPKVGDRHIDVKTVSKQIGDRQTQFKNRGPLKNRKNDNTLTLARGRNGEWTPHDMRRTGATMMQALRSPRDTIDRCQNHILAGSKVRRHYLHHDYASEKRDAWQALGASLGTIILSVSDAQKAVTPRELEDAEASVVIAEVVHG
jgi:integrase